ncbi:hypothetical protein HK099_007193 [Clydaea vesicula]|uniref:Uncharacterized protein n=1 Tax=Clydaea vesicula TaxID=447962 RepID=A0AAD5TX79_9FUNG|nr:hypothetical protein HK099_007193 [Clydaea vesicula]
MAEIELRCNNVQCRNALPNSGRACIYKNLDEKCNEVSRRLESVIREANQEINGMKEKYNAIQKEQELEKKKTFELKEQYNEKGRQFQKLQLLYDKLKRKTLLQQSSSMNLPPETPKAVHHPQLSNHQIQNIGNLHSARSQPISLSQGVPKFHQASQQLRSFNRFQHLQPETNNSTFANQNQLIFPARQPTPQNNISNSKNLTNSQHQFFQPLTFNSETVTSRRKSDESFLTDTVGLVKPNFVGIKC